MTVETVFLGMMLFINGVLFAVVRKLWTEVQWNREMRIKHHFEVLEKVDALENLAAGVISDRLPKNVLRHLGYDEKLNFFGRGAV